MGRHSAPDPEDSADEGVPEEPPTQRFSRQPPPEPDDFATGAGYGYRAAEYDRPDYDEPAYPSTPYPDGNFEEPGYDDSRYDEPSYDEPDYGHDYGQADFDEPADAYQRAESARGAVPPPRSGQKHSGEWSVAKSNAFFEEINAKSMQHLLSEPKRHVIFPSQADRIRIDVAFGEVIDEWVAKQPHNRSLLNMVRSEIGKMQSRH